MPPIQFSLHFHSIPLSLSLSGILFSSLLCPILSPFAVCSCLSLSLFFTSTFELPPALFSMVFLHCCFFPSSLPPLFCLPFYELFNLFFSSNFPSRLCSFAGIFPAAGILQRCLLSFRSATWLGSLFVENCFQSLLADGQADGQAVPVPESTQLTVSLG